MQNQPSNSASKNKLFSPAFGAVLQRIKYELQNDDASWTGFKYHLTPQNKM
jgi:hypothetical protein